MKKISFEIALAAELVVLAIVLAFGASIARAQVSPYSFPDHDVVYSCVSTAGDGIPFTFSFNGIPQPHYAVVVGTRTPSTDTLVPIITSVTNSAGADLTTGAIKLLAANAGLSLTVSASDNVGIVSGKLEVDGVTATPFGNGLEVLPNPFYVRWNSKTITAGSHAMRLTVCDAAFNCTQRTWSMTK